jgi:uncharacterized protein (DUF983 family)
MKKFTCPNCKREEISLKNKYLASIWQVIYCDSCDARLCAQPLLLALAYFIYTWVVVTFVAMAIYQESYIPLFYMLAVWLILDFINVISMPLAIMRRQLNPPE